MKVAITGSGVPIARTAIVTSLDGNRRAPLQTILHESWTDQERAAYNVYYVEVAPPEGQRWTGTFTGTSPDYEPIPAPTPEQLEQRAVQEARQTADELVRKSVVDNLLETVTDEQLEKLTFLYDEWSGAGVDLAVDAKVRRNGVLYRVVQAHTTQVDWPPESTPALFTKFRDPVAGPSPWVQPTGAQDAYAIGEQVTHDNPNDGGNIWIYESKIAANTTQPGRDGTFDRWWQPLEAV